MAHQSELIAGDIEGYLKQHEQKELLRFITCGSVDDGKSTLIGRLLHDSKMIYEDQLAAITSDSKKSGTTGEAVDLALLVDGLQSEREQGITIDVAYRYFSTEKRKFIIADTPGHEQYTRNMATGASTADLAIILIDARHGVQTQTKRHSFIVKLLGIKQVVVAINKMDLVSFDQSVFDAIRNDYKALADELGISNIRYVPLSALEGDNVVSPSEKMPWYREGALMELLENLEIIKEYEGAFRLPVQYVNRPHLDFRGFSGSVASGTIRPGEQITVLPSGKSATVKSIVTYDGELEEASAGMAVTITLNEEIDISRGDMMVKSDALPEMAETLDAHIVWMDEEPLTPGRRYDVKRATSVTGGVVDTIYYTKDVNTLEERPAQKLELNEIGFVRLSLSSAIAFDPYGTNRQTGSFVVIDRMSDKTVGAGMITGKSASQSSAESTEKTEFEIALNALVRTHFPHWEAKKIF